MPVNTDDLQPIMPPEVARHAPTFTLLRARRRDGPEGLDIALAGVPFDFATYQRAGSRYGPAQVREYSRLLRVGHAVTGIFPFKLCRIADVGDAPVSLLDFDGTIKAIEDFFRRIVDAGALPLAIGGEHTITLPILRAVASPTRRPVGVIHFDAHPDTIDHIDGHRINPATPFRRSVEEGLTDPTRHVMIGIRGTMYDTEAFDWARAQGMTILTVDAVEEVGAKGVVARIRELMGDRPVYVTYDLDGMDPAAAPGTNSPEPGGISVRDSQIILRGLRGLDIVGADVNELCPPVDPTGNTAIVAVNLMFEMLCVMAEARAARRGWE
jgi:guanidinopropionase